MKVAFSQKDGTYKISNVRINRYKILVGEHAGKIVVAHDCFARPYPMGEVVTYLDDPINCYGDGIWVPELNFRYKKDYNNPTYECLVDPMDKNDKLIEVGNEIWYASKNEICSGVVSKIGDVYYGQYGINSRKIQIIDDETGKKVNINNPSACVIK